MIKMYEFMHSTEKWKEYIRHLTVGYKAWKNDQDDVKKGWNMMTLTSDWLNDDDFDVLVNNIEELKEDFSVQEQDIRYC